MTKATSFDIAHMAGVSQSTVSRALSNSPLVNAETRQRIQGIAKQLNYKVDKNASNLRKQRSNTLAVLLFEDPSNDDSQINPFFISMLGSITKACSLKGYDLLVSFQNLSADWQAEYADTHKADGLILLGYGDYHDYESKLNQLADQNTKFVRWGAADNKYPGISVGTHNKQGGALITQHLIDKGYRKFAFVGRANSHAPEFMARYNGYQEALMQSNLLDASIGQFDATFTLEEGIEAGERIICKHTLPDAIVCASDMIALGVIKAMQARGLRCPEDIAVAGFDNIPVSEFVTPALTTVQQNTKLAGEMLVDNLLKMLNQSLPAEDVLIPAQLIVRESTQ